MRLKKFDIHNILDVSKYPKSQAHHIGIEIEFYSTWTRNSIAVIVGMLGLEKHVNLGTDCSIECPEHWSKDYHGVEMRVLVSKFTYVKVLTALGKLFKMIGAKVNKSCGLHVHLDMRTRDAKKAYENLTKCERMMFRMVHKSRRKSIYAEPTWKRGTRNVWDSVTQSYATKRWSDIPFEHKPSVAGHYDAISLEPFRHLRTIEVRMHHGTVDVKEIIQWVTFLNRIVDAKEIKTEVKDCQQLQSQVKLPKPTQKFAVQRLKKFAA
jgi:hypothetical protein